MENKKEKARIEIELLMRINSLRKYIQENVSTKDEVIPEDEDLSKSSLDDLFDIDIFFSRKPGMRRSVQLISSGVEDPMAIKLSCITALASLCDSMVANKPLNMTEEDIVTFMASWLKMHHISAFTVEEDNNG